MPTERGSIRHVPRIGEALFVTITDRNADAAVGKSRAGFEVILPASEDFIQAPVVIGAQVFVLVTSTDSMLLASRTHPQLPARLLEGFVPELTADEVVIMGIARDPGRRTKLAVAAAVQGVDPVSACVGRGGRRVGQVVDLLQGERLEVIAWSADRETYLANAFAPARVNQVKIDGQRATVWVDPHLMAAAVGENGQNSILAGNLLDLKVHVESATNAPAPVAQLTG